MHLERFSKNLKLILQEKVMNQYQLAKKLGVSNSCVSNWVRAYKEPTLENIYKMKEVLGCSYEELLD